MPGVGQSVEATLGIGVMTEGRSGLRASDGKDSAKKIQRAGFVMPLYSAPHR